MNGHIVEARGRAEAKLTATVRFTAASAEATYDWDEHRTVTGEDTVVWEGPCSVVRNATRSAEGEEGGRQLSGQGWIVEVPVDGTGVIARGHVATVLTVDPERGDPSIVGVSMTVDEVGKRTTMVLRRVRCVDTVPSGARLP